MLILGIETATLQVGCAIGGHEGVLASFCAARGRRHAETLTPAIEFVCRQARVSFDEIGAVAVDIGPGLFTGLRVGVATGQGHGPGPAGPDDRRVEPRPAGVPGAHTASRLIVAAVDARRGEVFYAFYRQVPGGAQRLSPYQLGTPADLASELQATGADCLLVGDGALRYPEVFADLAQGRARRRSAWPTRRPRPWSSWPTRPALREEFVQPWELEPLYLRKADAEINWASRGPGAGA